MSNWLRRPATGAERLVIGAIGLLVVLAMIGCAVLVIGRAMFASGDF